MTLAKKILIKVTFCTEDYHNKDPLGFIYVVGVLAIILKGKSHVIAIVFFFKSE